MGFVDVKNRYASNGAKTEWGINFSDVETADFSWLKTAEVTLTAAQINALNATPISIIPAQGAGKVIVVDKVVGFLDYGSATWEAGTATLDLKYTNGSGAVAASLANAFLESAADAYGIGLGTANVPVANAPIVAHVGTDAATGDSPIKLKVFYHVVDFN